VNSQNVSGYNASPATPGEFQRFAERYLDHLQVPYGIFDVASAQPPADLDSRQLIIAGHSRLLLPAVWSNAIASAVSNGTGFVNLDWDPAVGSASHIAAIFGASGSTAGNPATQISVPPAVAPGGATPHFIAGLQKKFDDASGTLVYPFHAAADGIVRSAASTILLNAQGTVIARLGNDPLIVATSYGLGRAVHFGTLDYLHADRFGFAMGVDDLFWRSLVWAARKPFALRGYPRLWAVQMDDTRSGWGTRVRDLYEPLLTGQASTDGRGGPWKITGYLFTDYMTAGSADRASAIADVNAGKLEVSPHSFADVSEGNMYWNANGSALTDQQWQTNMSAIDTWKQGNGGADTIPFFSRSIVAHFWNLSDNTGFDLWNHYGFRYITSIQKSGFRATVQNNDAERLSVQPFWPYEMPPKTVRTSFGSEDYPFLFADDYTVRSRSGLPAQTFFLFATQYIDFAKYSRPDFEWPNAQATPVPTVASSVAQLQQYTWRHWSGLGPVQLFTHDVINYQNSSVSDRQAVIAQSSSWLNANGVRHIFMDDLGDYMYARAKSKLTRATFDGAQLNYTFTGRAATADGGLISTQLLLFQGDTEGAWQTVPGFTSGLLVTRDMPPSIQSVSPTNGSAIGGTTVTISGTGFTPAATVFFGPNAASSTTFVNSSTLQAVSPPGPETTVEVRVATAGGSAALSSGFTYFPPPRVLVAAYGFNEGSGTTVTDSSGSGNNGTTTATTWSTAGKFGAALLFNGTSSWVTVPDSASLDLTTGMTLEAWVNPTVLGTAWRTAIMKEATGGLAYSLYANSDTTRPSAHVFVTSEQDTRGTAALPLNTWTHLAMTYNRTTLRIFVNGVEASNRPLVGSALVSSGALRIGGNSIWGEYFSGLIDEVRIYDRASTAAEIQTDMNTPLADATPPTVAMTAPLNGVTVSGPITASASASDNVGVAGVQFLLDGAPLGAEDTTAPYSITWNTGTVSNGTHTLSARARDASSNTATSSVITVTVANAPDTTPPSVSMTAPANGATVSGNTTVSANASDNVGVAGVQFLMDGNALGVEDTSAPYSITWNAATATSGPHTLSARARDGSGNITTSAVVNVTNVPPDTTAPVVSMTAPAAGPVSGSVTVSADASDNIGVAGVQFLLDGVALGAEDTTSPYSITWNSAASTNGSHTLSARARDAAGNTTTSATVTVTVSGGLTSGLVAAYGFNEGSGTTVADSSGSNNNGTTTATTWSTTGKFGAALSFNGTSSWVTVPDANSLDLTTGMTLEAWVNPTALGTAWRTVIMKEATGGLAYSLYGNSDTTRPSAHVFVASEQDTRGTAALALNTWTHLAMTYNGTTLRIFVNGVEASNKAISGSARVTTGALRIGGNSVWGEYFSGLIDEVRIYNRALSATEIQTDMNTPVGVSDTSAPTVSMTAPANGATVSGSQSVSANASDNVGVAGVQFLLDGAPLGAEDATSPYSITWNTGTTSNGAHTLSARARDAANNTATSTAVSVTVANAVDTTPPTVAMTSPADGTTVSGSVTVSANASDNVGVAGVQFLLDGNALGAEDTSAPYSITWNAATATSGPHTLSARARDGAGNIATSAVVTVTNVPPDTTAPVVSMTAPPAGPVSGSVTVSADASDNIAVSGVQFLLDEAALGAEDTTSPYSITWNTASATNGSHTLSARARDAAGNTTTSGSVTVTVSGGLTSGLVAAYGFNEGSGTSTADASGNGNNGTTTATTWSTVGKFGSALSFNGTSSWVTVPDAPNLDLTTSVTVEAWVNPAALGTAWRTAVMKEQTGGLVYGLYANSDTTRPSAHVFITSEQATRGTAALALNTWTHLAMTYNGTTLRIFVNGVEASNKAISGNLVLSNGALRIGGNSIWGEYFSGLVDEVRIYNRVLSANEIQSDMNTPINAPPPPPPPDTSPPVVSVTAPASGATVAGQITLFADASDNVGVAGLQFYVDGTLFGPEITSPPYTTTWNTAAATNALHTITAVARDAANNLTTSAPISVTVANTNNPAVIGAWSAPFNWPIVAINMVVTRTGEVISWDGPPSNGGTSAQLWTPGTGTFTAIPNNLTNMFCNAAVVLSDGRVLAIGGHADFGVGVPDTDIFDPITKQWSRVASMNHGRWYPTATVLPDGRVLAISGSDTCETCIVANPEIYDPVTNLWTELPTAAFTTAFYPLIFVLPDGRVLEAGATREPTVTRVLDLNTNVWTTVDPLMHDGHSAVMYEPGKIMKSGTAADVNISTAPAQSTTFTLDMTQASPNWQQTPNMAYPRAFHPLTLLPDGTVLVTSGGSTRDGVNYANSVLAAEVWSPLTKTWSTMSAQQNGRLYHANAVLLLDGRVLVAGSGRVGPAPQLNAEIFSPPYLFKGTRPTISSVPTEAGYGGKFFVSTPDATSITSVTLLRISAATHSFNMDQRFQRLSFAQAAGGLNVTAPANGNLAPPGYYVLFILNGSGVPSPGAVIRIH